MGAVLSGCAVLCELLGSELAEPVMFGTVDEPKRLTPTVGLKASEVEFVAALLALDLEPPPPPTSPLSAPSAGRAASTPSTAPYLLAWLMMKSAATPTMTNSRKRVLSGLLCCPMVAASAACA